MSSPENWSCEELFFFLGFLHFGSDKSIKEGQTIVFIPNLRGLSGFQASRKVAVGRCAGVEYFNFDHRFGRSADISSDNQLLDT